jgi:hypothetical protein
MAASNVPPNFESKPGVYLAPDYFELKPKRAKVGTAALKSEILHSMYTLKSRTLICASPPPFVQGSLVAALSLSPAPGCR